MRHDGKRYFWVTRTIRRYQKRWAEGLSSFELICPLKFWHYPLKRVGRLETSPKNVLFNRTILYHYLKLFAPLISAHSDFLVPLIFAHPFLKKNFNFYFKCFVTWYRPALNLAHRPCANLLSLIFVQLRYAKIKRVAKIQGNKILSNVYHAIPFLRSIK